MPLSVSIPTVIILIALTALLAWLFWNEQKKTIENKYPAKSIRRFFKANLATIYLLSATVFGLAATAIILTAYA